MGGLCEQGAKVRSVACEIPVGGNGQGKLTRLCSTAQKISSLSHYLQHVIEY
jgi:hypothetical protein